MRTIIVVVKEGHKTSLFSYYQKNNKHEQEIYHEMFRRKRDKLPK